MAGDETTTGPKDLGAQLTVPPAAIETAQALAETVLRATADMPFAAEPQQFLEALEVLSASPESTANVGENK